MDPKQHHSSFVWSSCKGYIGKWVGIFGGFRSHFGPSLDVLTPLTLLTLNLQGYISEMTAHAPRSFWWCNLLLPFWHFGHLYHFGTFTILAPVAECIVSPPLCPEIWLLCPPQEKGSEGWGPSKKTTPMLIKNNTKGQKVLLCIFQKTPVDSPPNFQAEVFSALISSVIFTSRITKLIQRRCILCRLSRVPKWLFGSGYCLCSCHYTTVCKAIGLYSKVCIGHLKCLGCFHVAYCIIFLRSHSFALRTLRARLLTVSQSVKMQLHTRGSNRRKESAVV